MPQNSMKKPLQYTAAITLSFLSVGAFSATDSNLGFADERVCRPPRIDLPQTLLDAREKEKAELELAADERKQRLKEIKEERAEQRRLRRESGEESSLTSKYDTASALSDIGTLTEEGLTIGSVDETDAAESGLGPTEEQEIVIEGDEINSEGNGRMSLQGDAQIVQGKRGVFADKISYDSEQYTANAEGNVIYYTEAGDEIKATSMELEVDTFVGQTGPSEMRLVKRSAPLKRKVKSFLEDFSIFAPFFNRGEYEEEYDDRPEVETRAYAQKIDIEGKDFQRLHDAELTRCHEVNKDVLITGKEIELDHASGVGYAKGVSVKFKGVPILYAPRLSFPINDERKSGFLSPSFGEDDKSGFMLSVPYYFNIAPSLDATLRTTWLENRGVQLYGEMRYMNEKGNGILRGEFLPNDSLRKDDIADRDDTDLSDDRYAIGLDYRQRYSNGWTSVIDLQDVSDVDYLRDFRNDIQISGSTNLRQSATLSKYDSNYIFSVQVQKYQLVSDDERYIRSKPYDYLPKMRFDIRPMELGLFELGMESELVSFEHEDGERTTGTRFNAEPYISLPYEPIYGFIKPKISLAHINYNLDQIAAPANDDDPQIIEDSITVPKFVVDSGLFFERDTTYGGEDYVQTLEPRVMYVNVGKDGNQENLPDFDTGEGSVSSFNYLFREDRFFGGDRIGDDHHIAVGVTTRMIEDETGIEKMSASIGQLYYLDDREVSLSSDEDELTRDESDIFASANAKLTDTFSVNSFGRYDAQDGQLANYTVGLKYNDGHRRQVSLDYLKRTNTSTTDQSNGSEDLNLTLNWPISPRLQMGFQQRYSLEDNETRSQALKLTYDGCCWAVGVAAGRRLDRDGEFDDSILFTFELDGLGSIRTSGQ